MKTTYDTTILGFGNHASIEIPAAFLSEIGETGEFGTFISPEKQVVVQLGV